MHKAIFLAKGFEEIEAVSIIDVLRRGEMEVDIISIAGQENVEGAHGMFLKSEKMFYTVDFSVYDMLVLPGGMPGTENLYKNEDLGNLLQSFNEEGKWLAAICAAPSILGRLGILEGKSATCYPGWEDKLLNCKVSSNDVVISQNIITGKGPGVAIKFALEIIGLEKDYNYVEKLRNSLILSKYN